MKIVFNKKKLLTVLLSILVTSIVVIAGLYFYNQNKEKIGRSLLENALDSYTCDIPPQNNAFFDDTSVLVAGFQDDDGNEVWQMHKILPYVLGYEEIGGVQYIIGGVKNSQGNCTKVAMIVSGEFDESVTRYLPKDWMKIVWLDEEETDFKTLQEIVKPGMQIEAYYLSRSPKEVQPDSICMSGLGAQSFCAYQQICMEHNCSIEKYYDYVDFSDSRILLISSLSQITNE